MYGRIVMRQPGGWEGRMRISGDFDDPLPPEIQRAFEGEESPSPSLPPACGRGEGAPSLPEDIGGAYSK